MSNQTPATTRPSIFEVDRRMDLARDIVRAVLLGSHGDRHTLCQPLNEFEEMFEQVNPEDNDDYYDEEEEDFAEIEDDNEEKEESGQKSIENLEKIKIQEAAMCSICLEEINPSNEEEGEGAVRIPKPCGHVYHHKCILKWLIKHCVCPLCRCKITS